MAFNVNPRHTGSNGSSTATQTLNASGSATPAADSLYMLFGGVQNNSFPTLPAWQAVANGGGLTYTKMASTGESGAVGGSSALIPWETSNDFSISAALWRAAVGGSPSSFTPTIDGYSGTQAGWYRLGALDITGHDVASPILQFKIGQGTFNPRQSGTSANGSVTLDNPITPSSLLLCFICAGADSGGGYATPTAGSGKTFGVTILNQNLTFVSVGIFARNPTDGTESQTVTCSNFGNVVGNWTMAVVEIKAAAASSTSSPTINPVRRMLPYLVR